VHAALASNLSVRLIATWMLFGRHLMSCNFLPRNPDA